MRHGTGLALAVCLTVLAATAARAASASAEPLVSTDLFEKARASGSVRVIVQIRIAEGVGRVATDSTKHALLAELTGTRYRVVRELPALNAIAIEASPETLRMLGASPRVERVVEDRLLRPQP